MLVKGLLAFLFFESRFIVTLNQYRFLTIFLDQYLAALIARQLKQLGKKIPPKENRVAGFALESSAQQLVHYCFRNVLPRS